MGLIKAAIIGGAAYYAVKGFRGDKEGPCGRRRKNQEYQASRQLDGEMSAPVYNNNNNENPDYYNTNTTNNAQSYPINPYPHSYDTNMPYPNDKKPQQQHHQQEQEPPRYQQLTFIEPKHAYHVSTQKTLPAAPGYGSDNRKHNDDAVEHAMQLLKSGDQDKAREVLSGAINRKY